METTMERLSQQKCEACQRGAPPVTSAEIAEFRSQITDWEIVTVEDIERLSRTFRFHDFAEALAFTNQVGALAEREGHHPLLITEWGKVTVQWWTHKIKGLHRNDLIMAAKTDTLLH